MKHEKKKKELIASKGHFVVAPFHLKKVLTSAENDLLQLIQYETNLGQKYISNSLIALEIGIERAEKIAEYKRNLVALGFISIVSVNRTRGTVYKVNNEVIANLVTELNTAQNSVERLRIADIYRTESGLESILERRIKLYNNTPFDLSIVNDRFTESNSVEPKKEYENPTIKKLNALFVEYQDGDITEREYRIRSNNIKAGSPIKITFDKTLTKWIMQNTNMN